MDPKPFRTRKVRRSLAGSELPEDLKAFYARHEGVGLDRPVRAIRFCPLRDVQPVRWKDLHVVGWRDKCPWRSFSAIRLGMSSLFDELLYILKCPASGPGAIMAFGADMTNGPGGTGDKLHPMSLVLAPSFSEWLARLERLDWNEPGIGCSSVDYQGAEWKALKRYYGALNPHSTLWGKRTRRAR